MKKLYLCLLSLLMMLSLAACQGSEPTEPTETPATPSPSLQVSSEPIGSLQSDDPLTPQVIELTDPKNVDLTTRQVVEGLLAGDTYTKNGWSLSVYQYQDGTDWIIYNNDPSRHQFVEINPNHLYPEDDWTPDSVLASYEDGSAPWLMTSDPEYSEHYQYSSKEAELWSKDYNTSFAITEDGWFTVNGINSIPFRCKTFADIDPLVMSARYRAGLWNGEKVWSEDYQTSVEFSGGNKLRYQYYNTFSENESPYAYAFTGTSTGPWWDSQDQYELTIYGEPDDQEITAYVNNVFPDLPDGTIEGSVAGVLITRGAVDTLHRGMTSVITNAGPYYFLRGELIQHWNVPVARDSCAFLLDHIQYEDDNHVYFFDGHRLLDLLADGGYDVILSDVAAVDGHEVLLYFYYLEGSVLKCYMTESSDSISEYTVISDRHVTDVTGDFLVFVTFEGDENVYSLGDFFFGENQYKLTQLGPGTVTWYDALWRGWRDQGKSSFDDFVAYCQRGIKPT